MDVEEKLDAIRKAAGEIRQIDIDSKQRKKEIYAEFCRHEYICYR